MGGAVVTYNILFGTQQITKKERKLLEVRLLNGAYGKCGNLCVIGELQVSQQANAMTIQIHVGEVKKNAAVAREAVGTLF